MGKELWSQSVTVNKLDAAERQFKAAVRMFFARTDPVSTHTLTCAASQLLADLLVSAGAGGLLRNKALINDQHWKCWIEAIKREENFFKHADKDPGAELVLDSAVTGLFLVEASSLLETVAQRVLIETRVMFVWGMHAFPEMFPDSEDHRRILRPGGAMEFDVWLALLDDPDGLMSDMVRQSSPPPMPSPDRLPASTSPPKTQRGHSRAHADSHLCSHPEPALGPGLIPAWWPIRFIRPTTRGDPSGRFV